MATVEAVEKVEAVEDEQETKRGRRKGQKLFNHDKVYNKPEDCKNNPPFYQTEKTVKEGDKETTTYEGHEEAEGFRVYEVTHIKEKWSKYVWGRNADLAIAMVASEFMEADLLEPGQRGRARKIDPIYIMFFEEMVEQNKIEKLIATLKAKELLHYLPYLGIDEAGNKVEKKPLPESAE